MDSFHKPSALSFDGNTSENWRRFKQQFDIYVTASGSEKKYVEVKIAILLNFAGEDAIEVFNTFQFRVKVKSCEYSSPVDDMVRDKFVFSIRDRQVKERLLREEKLALEKAISMARASEASKEQIKAMGPKEQNTENPTVNEIQAGGGRQEKNPPRGPRPGSGSHKGKWFFSLVGILPCFGQNV